jgi:colicin import membrane protein
MTPQTFNNGSRGENGNIFKLITLSLIMHVLIISTLIITVPTTSRYLTFGQAYSVQLVGSEVMIPAKNSSALNEILQPNENTNPIIIKREVSRLSSTPVKKEEDSSREIEKAISALREKESSIPQVKPDAQPTVNTSATARGNVPQAQASSRLNEYAGFIQSRIHGNWTLPSALWPKNNVETIIEVKILSNGAVERLNFEKRSGNSYFDDSAMKAVQKSMPFPPFPQGMMDPYTEIGIRFPSSELRSKK